jgi:hypothetical protein
MKFFKLSCFLVTKFLNHHSDILQQASNISVKCSLGYSNFHQDCQLRGQCQWSYLLFSWLSCSTTITVLPKSRKEAELINLFSVSFGCKPMFVHLNVHGYPTKLPHQVKWGLINMLWIHHRTVLLNFIEC